jgi:hypothetical protein
MSNPVLGINTEVLFIEETSSGERESCASGAAHVDLVSESLDLKAVLSDYPTIVGNRQVWAPSKFVVKNDGGGELVFRPRAAQMAATLKWIFGGTTPFTPLAGDDTDLPTFTVECTKAGQNALALVGAKVNTATFKSSQNDPLELTLNIIAMSGVRGSTNTAFATTQMDASHPFLHNGLTMSSELAFLDDGESAGDVEVRSIEFTIDNGLNGDAYCNSIDRRLIPLGMFSCTGSIEVPYNSITKDFWATQVAATKCEFTATWEDSDDNEIAAEFVVKFDTELPQISGTDEQWLTLNFIGVVDTTDTACVSMTSTLAS